MAEESDATNTPSTSSESSPPQLKQPRLWPGILAVALLWTALVVPIWLFPESPKGFIPMYFGLMGSYALAVGWWLLASRTPWRDRLFGFGALVAGLVAGGMGLFHSSVNGMTVMFHVCPYLITALVASMLLLYAIGWSRTRWVTLVVLMVGLGMTSLVRYTGANSSFTPTYLPRWEMTAEERLAASTDGGQQATGEAAPAAINSGQPAPWPGFRGPHRNGHVADNALSVDWQKQEPKLVWRRELGHGWSSFCIANNLAFTQEQRLEQECVVAYDADTGDQVWLNTVDERFSHPMGGAGPRATPTYSAGALYTTGAAGDVQRLDPSTGSTVWRRSLIDDTALEKPPEWGFASSPLVMPIDDDLTLVIVYAGNAKPKLHDSPENDSPGNHNSEGEVSSSEGTGRAELASDEAPNDEAVIAYNAATGEPVWKSGAGYHGYCSPHLTTMGGVQQVLMSSNQGLESLDPATGRRLWFYDWDIKDFGRCIQPLVVDDTSVVLSAGYDSGTLLLNVTKQGETWRAEKTWDKPSHDLEPYFNDMVLYQGHLYGIHKKFLVSIDLKTGKPTWPRSVKRKSKLGNGQLVLDPASGMLLVTTEDGGEVLLVEANPKTLVIRGRFKALEDSTNWNHPAVANGRLYVRNGVEAACYELPAPLVAQASR